MLLLGYSFCGRVLLAAAAAVAAAWRTYRDEHEARSRYYAEHHGNRVPLRTNT